MSSDEELITSLKAHLDEDEATARYSGPAVVAWLTLRDDAGQLRYTTVAATSGDSDDVWCADGHVLEPASVRVVYDPARALREVAAKRAILDLYEKQAAKAGDNAMEEDRAWTLWPVIQLLADAYEAEPSGTGNDGERDMWTIAAWLPRGREAEVAGILAARGIEVYRMWQPAAKR